MATLAIAVVVSQFRTSYIERELALRTQTEHYVKAMEAHVVYSIQSVDLSLIGFANAIKVLSAKQSSSTETMTDLLSAHGAGFNNDYWITFINTKGDAVATSTGTPDRRHIVCGPRLLQSPSRQGDERKIVCRRTPGW
jgi:hypothetical protein